MKNCNTHTNIDSRLKKVIDKAKKMDLTYFEDSDGKHCICNVDFVDRYDTLKELEDYLDL